MTPYHIYDARELEKILALVRKQTGRSDEAICRGAGVSSAWLCALRKRVEPDYGVRAAERVVNKLIAYIRKSSLCYDLQHADLVHPRDSDPHYRADTDEADATVGAADATVGAADATDTTYPTPPLDVADDDVDADDVDDDDDARETLRRGEALPRPNVGEADTDDTDDTDDPIRTADGVLPWYASIHVTTGDTLDDDARETLRRGAPRAPDTAEADADADPDLEEPLTLNFSRIIADEMRRALRHISSRDLEITISDMTIKLTL